MGREAPLRILVAGASGVIGRRLIPMLVARGHHVTGLSRRDGGLDIVRSMGADAARIDALDATSVRGIVLDRRPDVIMNQLTDLSGGFAPDQAARTIAANARIREAGTRNLVEAAIAAAVGRIVSQSIAWLYAVGSEPHVETDRLRPAGEDPAGTSVRGVLALERATLGAPDLTGVVLRYGSFRGPGAGEPIPGAPTIHVDAAAAAAVLALAPQATGIYNVADAGGGVSCEHAIAELGWDPAMRSGRDLTA